MSLFGMAAGALRAAADVAESLGAVNHGPWCEESKQWAPDSSGGRLVPIRIADDVIARMWSDEGWPAMCKSVHLRNLGDGTYTFFFEAAEEVDQISNRVVQQMMMTALDLSSALDSTNCDLSEEAIVALSAFKKAARQRLSA